MPIEIQSWTARGRFFVQIALRERYFLMALLVGFLLCGMFYDTPSVAMWLGFVLASYSAVANDSIQTLGTFIASNRERPWWQLWAWVGGIFLLTVFYSWWTYSGDVSYGRLASKGFDQAPTGFHFLQISAPLFLIILTRLRMPVSTTFLLLGVFAATGKSLGSVITKSISGYAIAFVCAILLWSALGPWMKRRFTGQPARWWRPAQWVTTGVLWSVWLQQDASNIAVFLPRSLSAVELIAFAGVIFTGLGILLYLGGEKIQEVVDEKADVVDVRMATIIDLLYAVILYVFKIYSKVPMSTTWVFVGLLAGREIAMAWRKASSEERTVGYAASLVGRDLLFVVIGFVLSLIMASVINPTIARGLFAGG